MFGEEKKERAKKYRVFTVLGAWRGRKSEIPVRLDAVGVGIIELKVEMKESKNTL